MLPSLPVSDKYLIGRRFLLSDLIPVGRHQKTARRRSIGILIGANYCHRPGSDETQACKRPDERLISFGSQAHPMHSLRPIFRDHLPQLAFGPSLRQGMFERISSAL
jgi:hypothetical protein